MSKPLIVSIPHRLGKEEALRRLKSGLASAHANFGQFYSGAPAARRAILTRMRLRIFCQLAPVLPYQCAE
jgi:hypothetical protein